jgi:Mn-dependent DtxR family transcriptional regulator
MRPPDDRVLEAVREYGNLTPKAASKEGIVARVDISRKYAGVRMRELTRFGLLCRVDEGLYGLTEEGHAYLNEELDASELKASDEAE